MTEITDDTITKGFQLVRSSALADVLTLSGVQIGSGDIYKALGRLAIRFAPASGLEVNDLAGEYARLQEIFNSHLTETRDCPKCGARVTRLKDRASRSWYHERPDWGWRRACMGSDQ